jgi:predicted ester cyclase
MSDSASVLRELIEHGFGAGDLSSVDRAAGRTIREHEYLAPVGSTGVETLRAMINEARTEMPGMTMTVEDIVVDGEKVWARSVARTVHPATGAEVTITVFDLCRFEDGRIVEHWGVPDRFALLHQIGALPPRPVANS